MTLHIGSKTDVGRQRENNEDTLHRFVCDEYEILIVCDGMGGHQAGEVASQLAVEEIEKSFRRRVMLPITTRIRSALEDANTAVFSKAQESPALRGMGTTCVMLVADTRQNLAWIAHVGDSRCYRLSARGEFMRLTKDHSHVQELLDAGLISEQDAATSELKNVITRALGVDQTVQADVSTAMPIHNGDRFLLCTDGLTDMVTDAEIAEVMGRVVNPQAAVEELVNLANARGGRDNITVCLAAFGTRKPVPPKNLNIPQRDLAETKIEYSLGARIWHYGRYVVLAVLLLALAGMAVYQWKPEVFPNSVHKVVKKLRSLTLPSSGGKAPSVVSTNRPSARR